MLFEKAARDLAKQRELELQQAVLLALRSQPRIILELAEALNGLDLGLDSSSPEFPDWYSLAASQVFDGAEGGQVVDYDALVGNHPPASVEPIELEGARLFQPELDISASGTDTDTLDIDWGELGEYFWKKLTEKKEVEQEEKEPVTFSAEAVEIWEFFFGKKEEGEVKTSKFSGILPIAGGAAALFLGGLGAVILHKVGLFRAMFNSRKSAEITGKVFVGIVVAILLCIPVVNGYVVGSALLGLFLKLFIPAVARQAKNK